ncbi:MAG: hypothetical protein LUE98_05505 [Tannerellaceae bacterium]|nr:hypothetical protein [Tannerellaceae bacterium]
MATCPALLDEGYKKLVIILTRNKGYRKKEKDFYLPGFIYRKYPAIREQLKLRYRRYNEVLDYIDELENKGVATVIRPVNPVKVERTDRNTQRLEEFYQEGCFLGAQFATVLQD